ncbi:MAG: hypothetical protein JXB49_08520, partial [Bacteroidales bacterium]|nr:hypothetical protein [Bacteroidales bacterium]
MKIVIYIIAFVFIWILPSACKNERINSPGSHEKYKDLKENFKHPESVSGVNCWWWWLNGNVNKAAIAKDLEAMKSRNFQGAMVFDAGGHNQRGNRDIPAGPLFGSDEWNELFLFALDKAKSLGLEIGFNIQSGWNLGGPRVTPQYAAKQITYSETKITGDKNVSVKLELPAIRKDFYKDIVVLAIPVNNDQKTNDFITDLDLKLSYHEVGGSAPDTRFLLTNSPQDNTRPQNKPRHIVKKEDIINLTSQMNEKGVVTWEAPAGDWSVLRIGYTCTNSHVSTSSG